MQCDKATRSLLSVSLRGGRGGGGIYSGREGSPDKSTYHIRTQAATQCRDCMIPSLNIQQRCSQSHIGGHFDLALKDRITVCLCH